MDKISDLKNSIIKTLDINKAQDIISIDLKDKSSMADFMIIASGTSSRHIQSLSEQVLEKFKDNGIKNSKIEGADNLVNFHKWHKWKQISEKCNILVFDRYGYKKKSLNSKTYKTLKSEKFKFVNFNKVNISSSQLRKI